MNPSHAPTCTAAEGRSAVLAELIDRLTSRAQAGERLDRDALAAEHPDFADELRVLLPAVGLLGELSQSREASAAAPLDEAGGVLGDYRIVREVGGGGQGFVYEAEQISLGRRVALKVLPFAAVLDPRHLQRFRNEARAAASLDHPNVVKVFAVGCERGVHFIAMQFIDGRPLSELIRARRGVALVAPAVGEQDATATYAPDRTDATGRGGPPSARTAGDAAYFRRVAEWGAQAAEALEHAHELGVVHRDVKPGNLLVDGAGKLYVADFGLAKLAADAGVTGSGDLLGTLRYMSPEQAESNHDLVDHRSDVYSLGVTLYELLTLAPAFDGPDRQSILTKIAAADPAAPRKLDRSIPRDLETVVLKAMEKEPSRRYQSAGELAADLRCFQQLKPVRAKRPSPLDRASKWARRHSGAVWAGVILLAVTAAVSSAAAVLIWQQKGAKELALQGESQQRDAAEANARKAVQEKDRAEGEKQIAEASLDFLLNRVIRQADPRAWADTVLAADGPGAAPRANPTVRELLDRAAADLTPEKLEARFPGRPRVQAAVLAEIGDTYREIGETTKAVAHLTRARDLLAAHAPPDDARLLGVLDALACATMGSAEAVALLERVRDARVARLGPDHLDTLAALRNLGCAYVASGRVPEGVKLLQQVRDAQVAWLGADSRITLISGNNLALNLPHVGDQVRLLEQVLAGFRQVLGPEHPHTLVALFNLATLYTDQGRWSDAVKLLEPDRERYAQVFGPDHELTLRAAIMLGRSYWRTRRPRDAVGVLEPVRGAVEKAFGPDSPRTQTALNVLAMTYGDAGRAKEAVPILERLREQAVARDGPRHENAVNLLYNLGSIYGKAGRAAEAVALLEQLRDIQIARLGPDHGSTLTVLRQLGAMYVEADRPADAAALNERLRDIYLARDGRDHPDTLIAINNLASAYRNLGRDADVVRLLGPERGRFAKVFGPDDPKTLAADYNLAVALMEVGRPADAAALLERVLAVARREPGPNQRLIPPAVQSLVAAYERLGRHDRLAELFAEDVAAARKQFPAGSTALAGRLDRLGVTLILAGKPAEAEPVLRECLAIGGRVQPDTWVTSRVRAQLGWALLGQKKYAEAEPLLRDGYAGMKRHQRAGPPPQRALLPDTADRLIELYSALGKADEVAKWRAERAKYPPPVAPAPRPVR